MNGADGIFASLKDKNKTGVATMLCNMQDKKDLMAGFRSNPTYKWYFKEKKQRVKRF